MAEMNATILIPDISGFTEFMTTTELSHASHAINILMDAILKAVGEAYEVSEIEGDAVLLIKKGPAPSKQEILDICLKIFNAFHFQRKWMEQYTICPCGACKALIKLTLKFVVHHGPLVEIKVGNFIKQSGTEMIVAHRLLKNSIDNHEYLLMSEKLLQQAPDLPGTAEMEWISSSDEYDSIGKVDYRFKLLDKEKNNVPEPPAPQSYYQSDDTPYMEIPIAAGFLDSYLAIMDIPGRPQWVPGLQRVEQDIPEVFTGSNHHCVFEDYQSVISPLRMVSSDQEIMYAESCTIKEMNFSLVYEFVFKKTGEHTCTVAYRFMNAAESPLSTEENTFLFKKLQQLIESLKAYCEGATATAAVGFQN